MLSPSPSLLLSPLHLPFFVSHIYIFLSLCHTHTERRVSLTDEVQRTRERGACAGLHDCRNCRYAAKVEGVQRQPCARLLSVFLSVFSSPDLSFFSYSFFFIFPFFSKKVMVHSCRDKISKNDRKRSPSPTRPNTRVICSSSRWLPQEFFTSALTYRKGTRRLDRLPQYFNTRHFPDAVINVTSKHFLNAFAITRLRMFMHL